MCGVVGGLKLDAATVRRGLKALAHRGPDASGLVERGDVTLGHARLAIVDLDSRSDQPFRRGDVSLSYNGELWNYRELRDELRAEGEAFSTEGDTEVVAAALSRWGARALDKMNGMFAMAWTSDGEVAHLARDRFGEVPLHFSGNAFASELKALRAMGVSGALDVGPGERIELSVRGAKRVRWYEPPCSPVGDSMLEASARVFELVGNGARERAMSDVPVCTLLSGGIDSAAVAYFLSREIPGLVAYTAVMNEKSPDLVAARVVAKHLGIELREVHVPAPTPSELADVVEAIEMPFKAQVEIGWACIKLAERMREDGFKVTFSGEGSDELWGSYSFEYHATKKQGWHEYRRDLFLDQARKNFQRCNKVFMSRSIECRLPFLHPPLVEYALSLRREAVRRSSGPSGSKAVLQKAFVGRLPGLVVRRGRLAFQNGLGMREVAAAVVAEPKRYYAAEFARKYR